MSFLNFKSVSTKIKINTRGNLNNDISGGSDERKLILKTLLIKKLDINFIN